ncbi:MAG TPA: HEAT repeat domain-containing protein [Methanomicrobiales archaeon]|nr:HEAT repeat domain-containing protein [Methanomicrobiales archaeon]
MRPSTNDSEPAVAHARELISVLVSHPDPEARVRAASGLGGIGGSVALHALAGALHDPEKNVRREAALALATIGEPAIDTLVRALGDGDWVTRYRAAEALGSIRDGRSVSALLRALGDERDHVRYMAAKGLGRLGDRQAMGRLSAALADENEFVRRAAREALAGLT